VNASFALPDEQAGLFEHAEMLRHRGQRHVEGLGKLANRQLSEREPGENGAAGRITEGCEGGVECWRIVNQSV
jgi:hypothetical protein